MKRFLVFLLAACCLSSQAAAQQMTPPSKQKTDKVQKLAIVEPAQIRLNRTEIDVFLSQNLINPKREGYQLMATVLPENATNKNVLWESTDRTVATVDAKGYVTPMKIGSTVVRAYTQAGRLSAECGVVVEYRNQHTGNNMGNLMNHGYMARQGSWLYFADPSAGMRLSKMKLDGSRKTRICNDAAAYINVVGGTIYYVNLSDGSKLYSIDIYGENRKWLNDASHVYGAQVYGSRILYGALNPDHRVNLYRMHLDGTGRSIVDWPGLGSVASFYSVGDFAFFSLRFIGADVVVPAKGIYFRPLARVYRLFEAHIELQAVSL